MMLSSHASAWPAGIVLSAGTSVWLFPAQNVVFTQTSAAEVALADVHALIDFFLWLASTQGTTRSAPVPAPIPAPTVVHDWRSLRGLSRECRSAFMARRAEIKERPGRVYVAVRLNPVYRMALQTAMLGVQMLTQAQPTQVVDDPFAVLARFGVGAPDAALHRRLQASFREHLARGA